MIARSLQLTAAPPWDSFQWAREHKFGLSRARLFMPRHKNEDCAAHLSLLLCSFSHTTKGPCWLIIQIPQSRNSWQLEPQKVYFLPRARARSLARMHAHIYSQTQRSLLLMLLGGGFFTFSVDDTYIKSFMAVCCRVISFFCGAGKFSRMHPAVAN